jgi:transposase
VGCTISFIRDDLYRSDKKSTVRTIKKPKGYKDDIYIDDLPEDKLKKLRKDKLIGIDPGLSDIIFCTDGHIEQVQKPNGKVYRRTRTFQYSNGQRKSDMKSKIYANKIEEDKKQTIFHGKTVKDIETILSLIIFIELSMGYSYRLHSDQEYD